MTWRDPKSGEKRLDRGTEWFLMRDGKIAEVRAYHHGDTKNPAGRPARLRPRRARLHDARGLAAAAAEEGNLVTVIKDSGERALLPPFTRGARGAARDRRPLRQPRRSRPTSTSGRRRASSRASCTAAAASSASSASSSRRSTAARAATYLHDAVWVEELARSGGSGGVAAGLDAHTSIAMPPIFKFGTEEQKQRWLVPGITGEKIGALGITEPGAGSDVAGISDHRRARSTAATSSTARRPSSPTASAPTSWSAPCKTTEEGGHHGISFLVLERDMPGYEVVAQAGEDGLALLRHRRALLHRRRGARREPARRGERGLQADHGQLRSGSGC